MTPEFRRVRLPKVMKDLFVIFSRCGGDGLYAVYGAWVMKGGSAQTAIHRNGFFILFKSLPIFNLSEIFKLYYNIMSSLFVFPLRKREFIYFDIF